MKLYAGSATEFIQLNIQNKLADILHEQFLQQFGYNPSQNEVMVAVRRGEISSSSFIRMSVEKMAVPSMNIIWNRICI
ncbi:hypothetical protein [Sphingobacterium gobiense]|uniref:Uncharacterized protein n=1 Tax=Sphingobacterium gobiense TaxID=1382456 RepID=A0A2S9JU02_9SPHI|nr:hypothetical protein [Sphingobacterium gobiense]PRD56756.1 hypothetical protein C5749_05880 [Sphingobacterium gobiense]